ERARELLEKCRILAEVERDQHHVDGVRVERVVQALDQPTSVPGHAHEPDLPLLLRARGELAPLGVLQPVEFVDGVVEGDIYGLRPEALETLLELAHHRVAAFIRARQVFDAMYTRSRLPRSTSPTVVSESPPR